MRSVHPFSYYSKNLEWARQDGDLVSIGITDFAQYAYGEIVLVDLPKINSYFSTNAVFSITESSKTASEILMPIAGIVVEINGALLKTPNLINEDPYGKAWFIKIKPENILELKELMSPSEYDDYVGSLFRKN